MSIDSDSHQLQENPRAVEDPWAMSCSSSQPRSVVCNCDVKFSDVKFSVCVHMTYHMQFFFVVLVMNICALAVV